jgi:hypothetical protein
MNKGGGETLADRSSSPPALFPLPYRLDDDESDTVAICHMCRAVASIRTEWAQGDRVCTSCGFVHAQHLMDSGPEWRDYGDNDDSGNAGNRARSGMVATDETKYVGGLQPTTVSRYVFGQSRGSFGDTGSARSNGIAQRLAKANRCIDKLMEQRHKTAFTNAALNLKLLRKRRKQQQQQEQAQDAATTDTDTINTDTAATTIDDVGPDYGSSVIWMEERPEFEQQLLEQEELVARKRHALFADKWSLERAKQWHSHTTPNDMSSPATHPGDLAELPRDEALWTAARDLYACHQMLVRAGTTLQLPVTVTDEAATLLCQYAARRDGLKVKGIATTLSTTTTGATSKTLSLRTPVQPAMNNVHGKRATVSRVASEFEEQRRQQRQIVRDANKQRQMGALCAALLFWTARHRRQPRSLAAVCDSIGSVEKVLRKHCSRAMSDLKEHFPELATISTTSTAWLANSAGRQPHDHRRPATPTIAVPKAISVQTSAVLVGQDEPVSLSSDDAITVANFAEHSLRKLNLPPVAKASIRFLVFYQLEHFENDATSISKKLPPLRTMCAALTYFVCCAGSTMQQLAQQAKKEARRDSTKRPSVDLGSMSSKRARFYGENEDAADANQPLLDLFADSSTSSAFSFPSSVLLAEQREYEMLRMWDAWSEQMPWSRTLQLVEQSTDVSRRVFWDYYKKELFPNRKVLLEVLCEASSILTTGIPSLSSAAVLQNELKMLRGTPLVSVLLPHISVVCALMKADEKF